MAKTHSDLIRELTQEVTSGKTQLEWLKTEAGDVETRLRAVESQLSRLTSQVEELRRRQDEADTRWKWLIATFIGLLISLLIASLTLWLRK